MKDKIKELECLSRSLEPDKNTRSKLTEAMLKYSEDFLNGLPSFKAYESSYESILSINNNTPDYSPSDIEELIRLIRESIDKPGINPASGRHFGYIPGGGVFHSAVGDFMAAVSNRYAGVFFASPGAVGLENMLIKWMAELVGYPAECGGNLTSGGSISNLIAVVTARDSFNLKAAEFHKSVVYLTVQAHHSVDKALRIAGLGECVKHYIPIDENYRMIPGELERAVKEDKIAGLIPWLVVASAGTTDVGAVDPLIEIGEIAKSNEIWYHIDGAYGAFFALCETGKKTPGNGSIRFNNYGSA